MVESGQKIASGTSHTALEMNNEHLGGPLRSILVWTRQLQKDFWKAGEQRIARISPFSSSVKGILDPVKKLKTNFFLLASVLSPSPISLQNESLENLLLKDIQLKHLPYLVHITHSDGGIEDVVQAAGGGLEARGGEAAHVLGDVITEEIHGEDDTGNDYPGPQRAPLPPSDVLIAMETCVPTEGVQETHINYLGAVQSSVT